MKQVKNLIWGELVDLTRMEVVGWCVHYEVSGCIDGIIDEAFGRISSAENLLWRWIYLDLVTKVWS